MEISAKLLQTSFEVFFDMVVIMRNAQKSPDPFPFKSREMLEQAVDLMIRDVRENGGLQVKAAESKPDQSPSA